MWGKVVQYLGAFLGCLLACPLGAGVQAFEGAGPDGGRLWSSGRVFRGLYPICRFALVALPLKYALFRILRRFIWVYRLLVWVCSFLVLCVACGGFCTRE